MTKKTLIAKRVSYGKKTTSIKDREYRLTTGGSVGTKKEWRVWAKKKNIKIVFKELKGGKK